MADFQEILTDISSKVSGDNSDEVKTSLKQLGVLHNDTIDKVKSFGAENKDKRSKITTLESKLRDFEQSSDESGSKYQKLKASNSTLLEEVEDLRQFKSNTYNAQKKDLGNKLSKLMEHPYFEKAKKFLHIPEADKEGNIDWDSLEENQVENNQKELSRLEDLDYFNNQPKKKEVDGSLKATAPNSVIQEIESATSMDALKEIQKRFNN